VTAFFFSEALAHAVLTHLRAMVHTLSPRRVAQGAAKPMP
jgi:hypothetical protein